MKKFLGILIVFTGILAMYFILNFFYRKEVSIIRMTEEGFEPRDLTVKKNLVIRFINETDEERWPASNLHPTHGIYPEFDPLEPIKPGESWDFEPDKVGKWKFHDHIYPQMRGSLTVEKAK